MLDISQFRELIIQSTLRDLNMISQDAVELLIFTCANESLGGHYLKQVIGPALGIYQMEPETHNDIWRNYIMPSGKLSLILMSNFNLHYMPDESRLIYDLRYATVMARLHYARIEAPLPSSSKLVDIWKYYKAYYNTSKGDANMDDAIANYKKFTR